VGWPFSFGLKQVLKQNSMFPFYIDCIGFMCPGVKYVGLKNYYQNFSSRKTLASIAPRFFKRRRNLLHLVGKMEIKTPLVVLLKGE
jgi:hypothetical protein